MLIRSVRLLNVKSFGTGPDGKGTQLAFDQGLNRIAGKNGVGKSTIIESLGYALFDAGPELGARMDLDTALLRHGAAEGEIEVRIETGGETYCVRRGVGKRSKLGWTVTDAGGFVTHDTEAEARRFLCSAAGLTAPEGLPDLFRKLIGARQGHLLDPLELPPAEARRHFAPILNVDIYQACFAELLEPAQRLKEQALETDGRLRAAKAEAELLAGAADEAAALEQRLAAEREELEQRRQELARVRAALGVWDQRAQAIPQATAVLAAARQSVENAEARLVTREELLKRAEQAQAARDANRAAHEAYLKAEKELAECAGRRPEPDAALRKELVEAEQWAGALTFAADAVRRAGRQAAEANAALANWDPARATKAKADCDAAQEAMQRARNRLSELEGFRRSRREMARDLEASRQCPILNDRCRQYDPGRLVLSEVKLDEVIEQARQACAAAGEALQRAQDAAGAVEAEEKATHTSRTQADAALTEISRHLALAPNEKARAACAQIAAGLAPGAPAPSWPEPPVLPDPAAQPWEALAAAADVAEAFCGLAQAVGETVARWRSQWEARQLSAFEELRARAARAEKARSEAADGHRAYLAAEADSGRLAQARADAALALGLLERARREAQEAHQALQAAQAAYDAQAHARARTELEESAGRVSALERDVARDAAQLDDARRRAERLKLAQEQWRQESQRKALLEGRRDVLEHLRRALRDAGPLVAEHLVQAVNLRARKIYAALSPHDPGQLDWQADYELRVGTTSGVRRFATLSGGQKVKAALALQLALVQQFSQAGICIFDEPTYALDAESRALLAEAIVEAQKVSRFEQLFIVSHDDAFDNLVEHTVVLEYSPASGTRLA